MHPVCGVNHKLAKIAFEDRVISREKDMFFDCNGLTRAIGLPFAADMQWSVFFPWNSSNVSLSSEMCRLFVGSYRRYAGDDADSENWFPSSTEL